MLDFRTTNTLWASVLVETLAHLGLKTVVISPGSRSTPLTLAFTRHPQIQAVPILDERSASFFALGYAKASHSPTVLVCTSGTAGANYFPAVIEADESEIPLLLLTADRPPELRNCASGQTIDQQKLYGNYVRMFVELALPEAKRSQLQYLRQSIVQAWWQCQYPVSGPLQVNCPFRDPLAPPASTDEKNAAIAALPMAIDETFFANLTPLSLPKPSVSSARSNDWGVPADLGQTSRGLIIAGPASPSDPHAYCLAIAALSQKLGWPILADGLSPLRNYASCNPSLVVHYDALLRHPHHAAALVPEQVVQIGALPTSKVLRQWLTRGDPQRWIVATSGRNRDPLHGRSMPLALSLEAFVAAVPTDNQALSAYGQTWLQRDAIAQQRLEEKMVPLLSLFEAKVSWQLPQLLPPATPVMIANSMPVRDVEWFWPLSDRGQRPYFSRGANGIDGTLSTAMGITQHYGQAVLLTGDLAFLHDSNGLLNAAQRSGHLTIIVLNNRGGGIFETLPIAQLDPPFEDYFATPQQVDLAALAAAHHVEYELVTSWEQLAGLLAELPTSGVRLLEIPCDRRQDAQWRTTLLQFLGDFDL